MLHLLPIRALLTVVIACAAIVVVDAVYRGNLGNGDALADARVVIEHSSAAAFAFLVASLAVWRWIPFLQNFVFPYLGGEWTGVVQYQGNQGNGTRPVTLSVTHTLMGIRLVLDSAESTSRTLVVHAERDAEISRNRLYYVYLNERKEGVAGAGAMYRGLAILRVEAAPQFALIGNYFTDQQGTGSLHLTRSRRHAWWKLWK